MFREIEDIVEILENAKGRDKKCSVLIGAGCSVTAGIPSAQGFVDIIKKKYPRECDRVEEKTYPQYMRVLAPDEQRDLIIYYINKAKINWAHIALAQLMKEGYVDRVLTTNFDPLVMRACSLVNHYPAVYDLTASQNFDEKRIHGQAVFHLHGQSTGFVLLNSENDLKEHSGKLAPIFEDAGRERVWLIVGYSGESDPVFEHLAKVKRFNNRLFWVGYKDNEPASHLCDRLLGEDKYAFYIKGFDADNFFTTLAQKLKCFPPNYIKKPFTHLSEMFDQIAESILPNTDSLEYDFKKARSYIREAIEKFDELKPEVLESSPNLLEEEYKGIDLQPKKAENFKQASDQYEVLKNMGKSLINWAKKKSEAEADILFARAKESFFRAEKIKKGSAAYNLACVYALCEQEDECHHWLLQSKESGNLPPKQHLEQDVDLDFVRNKKWFIEFIEAL